MLETVASAYTSSTYLLNEHPERPERGTVPSSPPNPILTGRKIPIHFTRSRNGNLSLTTVTEIMEV